MPTHEIPGTNHEFDIDFEMDLIFNILGSDNSVILADEIMVCDNHGIVLKVTETYEKNFGVTKEYVLGKSVYDLEAEGVFRPSITSMVLKGKNKITSIQYNRNNQPILTTGVPVFNKKNELKYVVCFNSIDLPRLSNLLEKYNDLKESITYYEEELQALRKKAVKPQGLVLRSKKMNDAWSMLTQASTTKANVLLTGETGVGKSLLAKEMHLMSDRSNGPFIEINCAVIHDNLIESELFGYEKGAFTGANTVGKPGKIELANNGTLFLDEIGELPLHLQAKLLQVIQEKTIERISGMKKIQLDFRLIVATNRNLEQDVEAGLFRRDLYYRLNVIRFNIPSLRERKEDIIPLALAFLDKCNREYGKSVAFCSQLMEFMERYAWPGNVRELENLVERMVITAQTKVLDLSNLPYDYVENPGTGTDFETRRTLYERLEEEEKKMILDSYTLHKTSIAVAKDLGISQPSAARKLRKYVKQSIE